MRIRAFLLMIAAAAALVVGPAPAQSARVPACSAILVHGEEWLGGKGVDVRSNGRGQGTGYSCYNNDRPVLNLNASRPIWGSGWQCGELSSRLYATKNWNKKLWVPRTYRGQNTSYGVKWYYRIAADGGYEGLRAHRNGSGYVPVPGDLIIHSNGQYGHVTVVDHLYQGRVYAVEQNASASGWTSYAFDRVSGKVSRNNTSILGYIHATKNRAAPVR